MFKNNNFLFEELNFFQENNKEVKLQRGLSNERANIFLENAFEYDCAQQRFNFEFNADIVNVFPALLRNQSNESKFALKVESKAQLDDKELDDNTSNLADTEEKVAAPVDMKLAEETPKSKNTDASKEFDTNEHSYDSPKFNNKDVDELLGMISQPALDMNAFLSDVLTAGPTDPTIKRKRAVTQEVKGKRVRKTKSQIEALTQEYERNSNWDNEEIEAIAAKLGLKKKQVYKWYWDFKAKSGELKPKHW